MSGHRYSKIDAPALQAQIRLDAACLAEERAYQLELHVEREGGDEKTAKAARKLADKKAREVNLKPNDKREVHSTFLSKWIAQIEEKHLRVATSVEDGDLDESDAAAILERFEETIAWATEKQKTLTAHRVTRKKSPAAKKPTQRKQPTTRRKPTRARSRS